MPQNAPGAICLAFTSFYTAAMFLSHSVGTKDLIINGEIPLQVGVDDLRDTTLELGFESGKGSGNWLNVDYMRGL